MEVDWHTRIDVPLCARWCQSRWWKILDKLSHRVLLSFHVVGRPFRISNMCSLSPFASKKRRRTIWEVVLRLFSIKSGLKIVSRDKRNEIGFLINEILIPFEWTKIFHLTTDKVFLLRRGAKEIQFFLPKNTAQREKDDKVQAKDSPDDAWSASWWRS